ncbi:MAG: response regulator transcription factor [Flavobacteriales bacterium]|nr:response regulator transcription factor [Flavobacteriales bacterium]MCB9190042.1 response regulator transcription factor [Flavobacteriales bacterium]MCB9205144.1 response regulator transcription factor [Flavobacteriales bacterium]
MGSRILLVEDELGIAKFLKQGLEEESFEVDVTHNGREGLLRSMSGEYDLLLLDWVLPGMSGLEVCKHFRSEFRETPIIFLTAKDGVDETVYALQAGANDYVKKPFHFSELLERIKVQLRQTTPVNDLIEVGPITMDTSNYRVTKGSREIALTRTEFALLEFLARNKGVVCSRESIFENIWGSRPDGETGVIDVHINSLRKKLRPYVAEGFLRTVRGVGYSIEG